MIKPPLNYVNKMHLEEYFKKIAPTLNNFVEKYLVHKGVKASFRSVVTEPPKSPPGLHLPKGIYFPDYKTYKVEDVPELMEVQKQLAARGLKDPWLRNYVWRYHPDHVGTKSGRMIFSLGRGLRTGAVLIFLTWIYETYYKEQDHHGHGGHHGSKVEHDLSSH